MTLPHEEVLAIETTRQFLRDLLDPRATPRVSRDIRRRAGSCLHHYPMQHHITRRWADEVCECGDTRELCRKCSGEMMSAAHRNATHDGGVVGRADQ